MNENIETIKRKMLVKYPFFGSVVANVDYKETRDMDTAGTDGQTIYYNPDFLKKLKSDEQIFIFAHEVCHIAFDHIRRSEGKDPDIWNTATDAVINQFLKRDGLKIVGNGVDIAEAINYDAEQLYDKLLQQKKQNQEQDNQQNQENSSSSEQNQNSSKDSQKQNEKQSQGQSSETQSQKQSNLEQKEQNSSSSEQNQNSSEKSQNQNENQSQRQSSETRSQEQSKSQQKEQNSSSKQNQNSSKDSQNQNENQSQRQCSETQSQEQSKSQQKEQNSSFKQNQNSSKDSQSQNENKSKENSSSDSSEENNRDVGHDTHSLWKGALKSLKDKLSKNKKESSSDKEQTEEQMQKSKEQGSSSSKQDQNKNQSKENSSSDSSEEKNHDVGHDTHSLWKDAVKRQKEKESKAKQESNKHQTEEQKQKEEDLKQEITYISTMGEKRAFNKNLEEKKKELEALKQVLIEQVMEAGTSTNREQRIINDIGKSKPIIDWRYVLREAIQYEVDWSYKNAYIEDGFIKANLEEQPLPETEIVLDTSESISDLLLRNFLRECKNILQSSRLKVGCFDTRFYGFQEIRTEEDIENMRFEGGGGTDFNVAVRAFTKRVENKIIFTDGYASMPNIPVDVIWIVYGKNAIKPMGGKVIHIDEEQLYKLCHFEQDISYKRKR